ncbi:hypothetical protein GCM10023322_39470 [Rugosimonospora acidiphila]|uniref:Uncharacterized protein n=1 Tax=Rugosimonospora acidiphila TaxID=556531 RepID=A0ABP9RY16_9ACTN
MRTWLITGNRTTVERARALFETDAFGAPAVLNAAGALANVRHRLDAVHAEPVG